MLMRANEEPPAQRRALSRANSLLRVRFQEEGRGSAQGRQAHNAEQRPVEILKWQLRISGFGQQFAINFTKLKRRLCWFYPFQKILL